MTVPVLLRPLGFESPSPLRDSTLSPEAAGGSALGEGSDLGGSGLGGSDLGGVGLGGSGLLPELNH